MEFLKINTDNGIKEITSYPRNDKRPIENLDANIEYYVVYDTPPPHDVDNQYLKISGYELTNDFDVEYTHLKIANRLYNIVDVVKNHTQTLTQSQILIRQL